MPFKAPAPVKRKLSPAPPVHNDPPKRTKLSSSPTVVDDEKKALRTEFQRIMLSLEKNINKNMQERLKYGDQPERFMDSEVDVDQDIKRLQSVLPVHPELFAECVRLNGVETLLGLLSHENVDIVTDTIDLLSEIVEPDVLEENEQFVENMVSELVDKQMVEICVAVLDRFDENVDDEAQAVHNTLHILENLVELRPSICTIVAQRTKLIDWLLSKINDDKQLTELEESILSADGDNQMARQKLQDMLDGVMNKPNKLYMCELLAIFLQTSEDIREHMTKDRRLDILLHAIAFFRRVIPKTPDEIETAENLFNALCASLMLQKNQNLMCEFDGIELMILFVRERPFARISAVKCLNYCLMNNVDNCVRFVNSGGIKTLFALLMVSREDEGKGKKNRRKRRANADELRQHEEHLISTLNALLKCFDVASASVEDQFIDKEYAEETRDRILSKFVEKGMEKTKNIMQAFFAYYDRVRVFDEQVVSGELEELLGEGMDDGDIYVERLSAGLFVLQQLICTIADLMINNADINEYIRKQLEERNIAFEELVIFLKEYASNTADSSEKKRAEHFLARLVESKQ